MSLFRWRPRVGTGLYEDGLYESQVYDKLIEAELQAAQTRERRSHAQVMESARRRLARYGGGQDV